MVNLQETIDKAFEEWVRDHFNYITEHDRMLYYNCFMSAFNRCLDLFIEKSHPQVEETTDQCPPLDQI